MDIAGMLKRPKFPRSAKYDPDWRMDNQMGLNAIWLMEWLCEALDLKPRMRVLDLGCGKAITSIFLAKEFGARVWAADLWIGPDLLFPAYNGAADPPDDGKPLRVGPGYKGWSGQMIAWMTGCAIPI